MEYYQDLAKYSLITHDLGRSDINPPVPHGGLFSNNLVQSYVRTEN